MHPHVALIHRFYDAFGRHDAEDMARCYHPDVVFTDPVFGELRGAKRAGDMWRMLCGRASDLKIQAMGIAANDSTGRARWIATYSFGKAKRKVRNVIEARFEFKDGLIVRHADSFPLWRWSAMALGPVGSLLGWTPIVQGRIRRDARRQLDRFQASGKQG